MIDKLLAQLADEAIRNGKIITHDKFKHGNDNKECYVVEYLGSRFYLTKTNGEWTYFHEKFKLGNDNKECYFVEYLGRGFYLTKTNGEWTYFHECVKGGTT